MKVSVIIPCYNFGEFIEQSILSAVNQITNPVSFPAPNTQLKILKTQYVRGVLQSIKQQ